MKILNIITTLGAIIIIITVVFKVMHFPGAETADLIGSFTFIVVFFSLVWENKQLRKQVEELKKNNQL